MTNTNKMNISPLSRERLLRAKVSYTPRHVNLEAAVTLLAGDDVEPKAGDLVLARIEKIGQHAALELTTGRRSTLFTGDEIVVCYGNRYAPDQFEAEVPHNLDACHLVAAGGVAAQALSWHVSMKPPTVIVPIGLLADVKGQRINLSGSAIAKPGLSYPLPYTLAVVGTSMNAGKTTTVANLIYGLTSAGLKVGAAKVTGTGSGKDTFFMGDAGAKLALDFTDAGFPSTFRLTTAEVEGIFTTLTNHLAKAGVDVIILEVADGLYQEETAALLSSATFKKLVNSVIFAAGDAMGAMAGVEWLRRKGLPVVAISGLLTASPLAIIEAANATGMSIIDKNMLRDVTIASKLGIPAKN
ncbi:MAG: molybdopterin-guanine dinucleotide biosynthesis protein MobB [Candidatus Nitrotoga sp.]